MAVDQLTPTIERRLMWRGARWGFIIASVINGSIIGAWLIAGCPKPLLEWATGWIMWGNFPGYLVVAFLWNTFTGGEDMPGWMVLPAIVGGGYCSWITIGVFFSCMRGPWDAVDRGCCAECGYDLRESAGLCPECGAEVGNDHRPG